MNPQDLLFVQRDVNSPPGGWQYTVPETGITIKAPFWSVLKGRVVQHLAANSIPLDDERMLLIEDAACRETTGKPAGWCAKRDPKPIAGMPIPLLGAVESFIRSVWGTLKTRQFVPLEEAQRRAAICRECPYRVDSPGGCASCYSLIRKANDLIDRNPIKFEPDEDGTLRDTCKSCLCICHIKVWIPSSVLDKAEGSHRPNYHPGCWRLEK